MPPKQCPECGRFLSVGFVAGLADASRLCPKCGTELTAAAFVEDAGVAGGGASVRPPDLAPDSVRDTSRDVLAGWDLGASDEEVASWRLDRRPFPTDTVVVLGAGAVGLVSGMLRGPGHRARYATLGALAGIVGAATARQVWRLTP